MVNAHPEEPVMIRRPTTPLVRHLVRVWRDIDHANRRMFEIQTGLSSTHRFERH